MYRPRNEELVAPNRFNHVHLPDNLTIHEWATTNFRYELDKKAVIDGPTGEYVTYGHIDACYKILRHLLITKYGLKKGDVFGIHAFNQPENVILILAVLSAGGIVTTLSPTYTQYELEFQLRDCSVKYLCTSQDIPDEVAVKAGKATGVKYYFSLGAVRGCHDLYGLLRQPRAEDLAREVTAARWAEQVDRLPVICPRDDCAFYLYSSGTTGKPKGVMLTHYNLVANMEQCRAVGVFSFTREETSLNMFPPYHVGGILTLLNSVRQGSTIVNFRKFQPETYIRMLDKYKVNIITAAPPIAALLSKHPLVSEVDLTNLTCVYIGAAPLGQELSDELKRRIPSIKDICQAYGMTELSPVATASGRHGDWKHGSAGFCIPNTEAKVVDIESRASVGCNQDGEICIRGPQVMKGYLNNPQATRDMIDEDGWLHTGDIGHYDEEGFFFIVDRLKELIKYNAYQVAPAELEDLLVSRVPGVRDVGVVGVPDPRHGELPRAYVVRAEGGRVTEGELMACVQKHLAPYKALRGGVRFVDEIPRSATGKILRRVLKAEAARDVTGGPAAKL